MIFKKLLPLLFVVALLTSCTYNSLNVTEVDIVYEDSSEIVHEEEELYMKAVWITQFDLKNILLDGDIQRDKESFLALSEAMFDNIVKDGYNTVIVQARPYADSFYYSDIYPTSNYVTGKFGIAAIYDPFALLVDLAHDKGLEIHAWLNPMRAMTVKEIKDVPNGYIIKKWYDDSDKNGKYLVEIEGRLYLNPAYEEVRSLIASGAGEVAEKYNIEGVHIDDYFYPTTEESFDREAYDEYKNNGGTDSLDKFRNNNLDLMVSEMYTAIKDSNKKIVFGISPAGNIDNTYKLMYADVYKWCSEDGYIDYICPQIYFGLEHETHDFISVYNTWSNIVTNENVKMTVGITLGKAIAGVDNYAGSGKNEWSENKDVIKRCLEYLKTRENCSGIFLFCYQHMYDPISGESVEATKAERENMKNILSEIGN